MRIHVARTLLLMLCAGLCACGGGSRSDVPGEMTNPGLSASFQAAGTAAAPDLIRLVGASAGGDLLTLSVAVAGPTSSSDLYSFAFDLVLDDPTVARYEPGTATAGDALVAGAGQALNALATLQGDRVVVGVTKVGSGPGNGIAAGEAVVVDLTFRVMQPGTTGIRISGAPGQPPVALDSAGAPVGTIAFDDVRGFIQGL